MGRFIMRANSKILAAAAMVLAAMLVMCLPALADAPEVGGPFPDITLTAPEDPGDAGYLGLPVKKPFKVPDIKSPVVIVEIFSMYCPYCQAEAPALNTLYEKIESDRSLKGRIKMVGIGVGNSAFEVNFFRKKYHIPFPLFADDDFKIHKVLGGVRTPYFLVVKSMPDGTHSVVFSQGGTCGEPESFLEKVVELGGL
jgi:peroxiredoxin